MKNKSINKNKGESIMKKNITTKRLEKILISLIKKVDYQASNIKVVSENNYNVIKVDHTYKNYPELNKLNIDWVSFGKNESGHLFYDVDGSEGRHYFGEQEYSVDLQVAWSYVQQELAKYNCHSEPYYSDGIMEEIFDGTNLNQKDLEENVFDRKPSEAVSKACNDAFLKDFPEVEKERKKLEQERI